MQGFKLNCCDRHFFCQNVCCFGKRFSSQHKKKHASVLVLVVGDTIHQKEYCKSCHDQVTSSTSNPHDHHLPTPCQRSAPCVTVALRTAQGPNPLIIPELVLLGPSGHMLSFCLLTNGHAAYVRLASPRAQDPVNANLACAHLGHLGTCFRSVL